MSLHVVLPPHASLLQTRDDVDPARLGVTGISLGGMHSWLLGALDTRVAVAAPMIGVQGFGWAVEHDRWHARVASIQPVPPYPRHHPLGIMTGRSSTGIALPPLPGGVLPSAVRE